MVKIDQKIVGVSIKTQDVAPEPQKHAVVLKRPDDVDGTTYKIKTPLTDCAFYVTVNHIEFNGKNRLFEIFISSKHVESSEWITALTRVLSAIFRQTDDVAFIVEELRSVFSPRGGYFKPGGAFMPSLVAEIGSVIERHMIKIGALVPEKIEIPAKIPDGAPKGSLCPKCNQMSLVVMDGCETCIDCGYSKCG